MIMTGNQNKDIYNKIDAILEERRTQAAQSLNRRTDEVYTVCPEIEEIDRRIRALGLAYNKQLIAGSMTVAEVQDRIKMESDELSCRKEALLTSLGYPANYLVLNPNCPLCADTGIVRNEADAAGRCACYRQMLLDNFYSHSNIASAGHATFELFDEKLFSDTPDEKRYSYKASPRENILRIKNFAQNYTKNFPTVGSDQNLYLFGHTGTGKTFLSIAIAKELMRRGFTVLYQSAPALFNTITEYRMRAFRDEEYSDAGYRSILTSDVLVIDDLGTESMTNPRYAEFITLLNERLGGGSRVKSTIIATNMDLRALRNAYDERISSRIIEHFKIIPLYGEDLRLEKARR